MTTFLHRCALFLCAAGALACKEMRPIGHLPDGAIDAGSDARVIEADAGSDAGTDAFVPDPGPCEPGVLVCRAGSRFFCDPRDGWLETPCGDGMTCGGAGVCGVPCAGLDARSDLGCDISLTTPLHTDVGSVLEVEGDPTSTAGSTRFPFGFMVEVPGNVAVDISREPVGDGGWAYMHLEGRTLTPINTPWVDLMAQMTARHMPRPTPQSAYFPYDGGMMVHSARELALWLVSPLVGHDLRYPVCRETHCSTPSREGTLLSNGRAVGTRWTVVTRPLEAHWDSCTSQVVVDAASFASITPSTRVDRDVSVTLSAAIGDAIRSTAFTYPPRPGGASGDRLSLRMYASDTWELVALGPRDEADCAPEPGAGCIHRCTHTADLTGTVIEASQPMRVIAGHECAHIPATSGACGHLLEAVPSDQWQGARYAIHGPASFEGAGATIRMLALEEDVELAISPGDRTLTLTVGEPQELAIDPGGMLLEGSAAFSVVRLSHGGSAEIPATGERTTPAMVFDVPIERWTARHLVPTLDRTVAIVVTNAAATISVDGAAVTATAHPIAGGELAWREVPIANSTTPVELTTSMPSLVEVAMIAPASVVLVSAAAP